MNNNMRNTAALEAKCKGVFSSTGYLNVGKECAFSCVTPALLLFFMLCSVLHLDLLVSSTLSSSESFDSEPGHHTQCVLCRPIKGREGQLQGQAGRMLTSVRSVWQPPLYTVLKL